MAESQHIPIFAVEIDGKRSRSIAQRITSFEYSEREKQANEATFTLALSEGETLEKVAPVRKGSRLRVRWGYLGKLSPVELMAVHSVSPDYTERTVKVTARDLGTAMGNQAKQKVWDNVEVRHIVQTIAREHGLTVEIPGFGTAAANFSDIRRAQNPEEAKVLSRLVRHVQDGTESDRAFLQRLAGETGCELHIRGKTLVFAPPPHTAQPSLVLRWRNREGLFKSFSVDENAGKKHHKSARGAKAVGVDPLSKTTASSTANDTTRPGRPVLGKTAPFGGTKGDGEATASPRYLVSSLRGGDIVGVTSSRSSTSAGTITPVPGGRASDVETAARAKHSESEAGGVTARATILGIPTVRRRQVVEIRGVLQRDAGKWMITGCSHKIDTGGYTVDLELKRHGQNGKGAKDAKTKGKSSQSRLPETTQGGREKARLRVSSLRGGEIVG